jgi:hypothetical protein
MSRIAQDYETSLNAIVSQVHGFSCVGNISLWGDMLTKWRQRWNDAKMYLGARG